MSEEPVPVALVLTPVASAAALAGLCSMTGLDVHVIPSRGGAVAVLELTPTGGALSAAPRNEPDGVGAAPADPAGSARATAADGPAAGVPAAGGPVVDGPAPDGGALTRADGHAPVDVDAAPPAADAAPLAADSDAAHDAGAAPLAAGVGPLTDGPLTANPLSGDGAPALAGTADDEGTGIDWDISELLGPEMGDGVPSAADELARTLSRLSKSGVVLLTATLATDAGLEAGLSGQLSARRYSDGAPGEEVPPGLILAGADEVVEDLILGRCRVEDVRGHERSGTLPRWKAAQMFAKGLRRRRP